MTLFNALSDVKEAVLDGESLDSAIANAAEDYDLNSVLIRRKFNESYKSVDALIALHKATSTKSYTYKLAEWIESQIEKACKLYNVPTSNAKKCVVNNKIVTIVCTLNGRSKWGFAGVDHESGQILEYSKNSSIRVLT